MNLSDRAKKAAGYDYQAMFESRLKRKIKNEDESATAITFSENGFQLLEDALQTIIHEEIQLSEDRLRTIIREEIKKILEEKESAQNSRKADRDKKPPKRAEITESILKEVGQPLGIRELVAELKKRGVYIEKNPTAMLNKIMEINPNIYRLRRGIYGLKTDRIQQLQKMGARKKTLRRAEIVESVLREVGRPLEIWELVGELKKRGVNIEKSPTVALNRVMQINPRIYRIRRGKYGLRPDKD